MIVLATLYLITSTGGSKTHPLPAVSDITVYHLFSKNDKVGKGYFNSHIFNTITTARRQVSLKSIACRTGGTAIKKNYCKSNMDKLKIHW